MGEFIGRNKGVNCTASRCGQCCQSPETHREGGMFVQAGAFVELAGGWTGVPHSGQTPLGVRNG